MQKSLTEYAREQIKEVHGLSALYNDEGKDHAKVLLELVGEHAEEISELYDNKDDHFSVEVGDLLILCHELLLEQGKDPDRIMELCYGRYKRKLGELIERSKK
jgi:hypothetical protein